MHERPTHVELPIVPDELERRLGRTLLSSATVFAFDSHYLSSLSPAYVEAIDRYCARLQRPVYRGYGNLLDERAIVAQLVRSAARTLHGAGTASAGTVVDNELREFSTGSAYRAACRLLSTEEVGVFCIHDAHKLEHGALQFLSRLIKYVKVENLRWQFILIGELEKIPVITHGLLHIDQTFCAPTKSEEPAGAEAQIAGSPTANYVDKRRPIWQLGTAMLILVGVVVAFLGVHDFTKQAEQQHPSSAAGMQPPAGQSVANKPLSGAAKPQLVTESLGTPPNEAAEDFVAATQFAEPSGQYTRGQYTQRMNAEFEQAIRSANLAQLEHLLGDGVPLDAVNGDGQSALIMAAQAGDTKVVTALLDRGAATEIVDKFGYSALLYACIERKPEVATLLLNAGVSANQVSRQGKSALILAVRNADQAMVELLIDSGATVNWQDSIGWSALFYAAWNDHRALVELLLERGADPTIRDADGYSPRDIAQIRDSSGVLPVLSIAAVDHNKS